MSDRGQSWVILALVLIVVVFALGAIAIVTSGGDPSEYTDLMTGIFTLAAFIALAILALSALMGG